MAAWGSAAFAFLSFKKPYNSKIFKRQHSFHDVYMGKEIKTWENTDMYM